MTQSFEYPQSERKPAPAVDLAAVKARQQAMWASGDFAVVGTTLQIVGESLAEAVDLQAGTRVLDVACGNGNASLAAARRFARVTGIDYVPTLLERAGERARAERLDVEFVEGDAENLPFDDGAFDTALSTYGIMFTADHERAAREIVRVVKPGGKIGFANWTPEGFIGQFLKTVGRHVPPPPGVQSPATWGTEERLRELFPRMRAIRTERKDFVFRYESVAHFIDVFKNYYGPTYQAFRKLDAEGQVRLERDIVELSARFARPGTAFAVPAQYLEVVIER
jgi:ubiquinone/menaquinone biosynthesis C-methylase UbiE